ncbi:unnamed protein product, partial [Brenthis ino]
MSAKDCSIKLRVLILVVNTANLINERATLTLGISHALIGPTAIFTTYVFIGIFVIGAIRCHYASCFLQIYALVACCSVEMCLAFIVFTELKTITLLAKQNGALVLDGVLPMICALLLLVDLTGIIFSNRPEIAPPTSTPHSGSSQVEIEQIR